MKVCVFSSKPYDQRFLEPALREAQHHPVFFETRLTARTAGLAERFDATCVFVNDELKASTLERLHKLGIRLVALRCAGFNNVDIETAKKLGMAVARVPAYSPHAVAEHTVGLLLALTRRLHKAYNRVRDGNFTLEGLLGFDLYGKTVGIVGTGQIGAITARILLGFGCRVIAFDPYENEGLKAAGVEYVSIDHLARESEIVSLHCPLTPQTHHLVDKDFLDKTTDGVTIVNTSRGALVDTGALVAGLKSHRIGAVALDVYEEETDIFFEDLSSQVIQDDLFARLLTFPNVLITGHQGFFTREALAAIASKTADNLTAFEERRMAENNAFVCHPT